MVHGGDDHLGGVETEGGELVGDLPGLEEKAVAGTGAEERIRADVEAMLAGLARELEPEGVAVTTHASADNPAEAILDEADRRRADPIVVGNGGTHNPRILGSVPNNVVHLGPCSVLVVHTWPPSRM